MKVLEMDKRDFSQHNVHTHTKKIRKRTKVLKNYQNSIIGNDNITG